MELLLLLFPALLAGVFLSSGSGGDSFEGDEIEGTDDADTLSGTDLDDTISGGSGNDVIDGAGREDVIDGGDGYDVIYGGNGDDSLSTGADGGRAEGGDGSDTLTGGDGSDVLSGDQEDDAVYGGAGNDTIHDRDPLGQGSSGSDTVDAGDGNDAFLYMAGHGHDLSGGAGDDLMNLNNLDASTIFGGDGNDMLNAYSSFGTSSLYGGAGDDYLQTDGQDSLYGGDGDDWLVAEGAGANLTGGAGADEFDMPADLDEEVIISDFTPGEDILLARTTQDPLPDTADLIVTAEDGGTRVYMEGVVNVLLVGVDPADLQPDDIQFLQVA